MVLLFILCFALLGNSIQANKGFQKNMPTKTHSAGTNENGNEKAQKITSAKDLLDELSNNTRRIIEESIYNETEGVIICWKNILYVNESDSETTHWQEYQVVFDFPAGGNQMEGNHPKEYKKYKIQMTDNHTHLLDFEVVYNHPNYTISKYENATCGGGRYLSKTYYEWPNMDKKRVVVRLTNDYNQFGRDRNGFSDQNERNDEEGILRSVWEYVGFAFTSNFDSSTNASVPQVDKAKKQNTSKNSAENGMDVQSHDGQNAPKTETPLVTHIKKHSSGHQSGKNLNTTTAPGNGDFVKTKPVAAENSTSPNQSMEFSSEDVEVPSDKPGSDCSPFITQFVSGNGLFQGLCKLKKDEKVILQGDILVSKKYVDGKNRDVIQPLFVIHENTEIEGSMDEVEETTTDANTHD